MSRKYDVFLMIVNGIFVVINTIFVVWGSAPSVNLAAALFCLLGFCIAFNHYMNGDNNEHAAKDGK